MEVEDYFSKCRRTISSSSSSTNTSIPQVSATPANHLVRADAMYWQFRQGTSSAGRAEEGGFAAISDYEP